MTRKLLLLASFLSLFSSLAAAAEEYQDQPPPGVRWGWQGHVQFAISSAAIQPQYRDLLEQVGQQMRDNPKLSLLLTGHTDNTGDPDFNKRLSQRRSQAVADFINTKGVDAYRITQRGVGELRPVASNACDDDRQRNRRVDLAYFPRHRTPPSSGGLVYSPSRPDPNDEAEACAKLPPQARTAASTSGSPSSAGSAGADSSAGAADGSASASESGAAGRSGGSGQSGSRGGASASRAATASGGGRQGSGYESSSAASPGSGGSSSDTPWLNRSGGSPTARGSAGSDPASAARSSSGPGSTWVNPDTLPAASGSATSGTSPYGSPGDSGYPDPDEELSPPPPGGIF